MRIEVIKNFLSPEEIAGLNAWADEGVQKRWLDIGAADMANTPTTRDTRVTSRLYGNRYEYSNLVNLVANRIRFCCGVANMPVIEGHGKNGVVVSCTFNGGDIFAHKDKLCQEQQHWAALRCNVMTRKPDSGGKLFVGGQYVPLDVGDLHCYLASEHEHYVTTVEGNTSRVLWMFGACVPAEDWDGYKIQVGEVQ